MKVERSVEIAAAPGEVYNVVMDPARLDDWVTIHDHLEDAPNGQLKRGSKLTQTLRVAGQAHWRGSSVCGPRTRLALVSIRHPSVVLQVAERQRAAFLPPNRAFDGAPGSPEAHGYLRDRLGSSDDPLSYGAVLLNPLGPRRSACHPLQRGCRP